MSKPVFLPGGKHTSSSIGAFVNYFGPKPDPRAALASCEEMFNEPMVIIDGSDDWGSPLARRPERFVQEDLIVGYFHTGTSGMTYSGVVIRQSDYDAIRTSHGAQFGQQAWNALRVVWPTRNLEEV